MITTEQPPALVVNDIGKAYKDYPSRWDRAVEWFVPRSGPRHHLHWVLQDITFTVSGGEAVGIVGVNGAGKSTLLKIISGTTQPTTGNVQISGNVAALLELGMGFHPDFTGRQNAVMAGQLRGWPMETILEAMPAVEAFATIGDYMDQPLRVYSSGMQMRLAFAVATAIRPDVLIVDEALSVGDVAFQRKCFRRIENYLKAGTTLLFVSHDIETVKKLCDKALFLKQGCVSAFGAAKPVCDAYERYLFGHEEASPVVSAAKAPGTAIKPARFDATLTTDCAGSYGNGKVNIKEAVLEDADGRRVNIVQNGERFSLAMEIEILADNFDEPMVNMQIKTAEGVIVYGINSIHLKYEEIPFERGQLFKVRFVLENHLAPGLYYLNCGFLEMGAEEDAFCHRLVDTIILKVIDQPRSTVARGVVDMRAVLEIRPLEDQPQTS